MKPHYEAYFYPVSRSMQPNFCVFVLLFDVLCKLVRWPCLKRAVSCVCLLPAAATVQCFAEGAVALADGSACDVRDLRVGDVVRSPIIPEGDDVSCKRCSRSHLSSLSWLCIGLCGFWCSIRWSAAVSASQRGMVSAPLRSNGSRRRAS
jgi:hypothetical protein